MTVSKSETPLSFHHYDSCTGSVASAYALSISCSSVLVTGVIWSFLLHQISQTEFQRTQTAIAKNPSSNCGWILWSLTWRLTLSYSPQLARAGNRHFSLFLKENGKFNPSSNCCWPYLLHKAGCFQLRIALQMEDEDCNQLCMVRERKMKGKGSWGSRLQGAAVQQRDWYLHWKHKRNLCFVGSQNALNRFPVFVCLNFVPPQLGLSQECRVYKAGFAALEEKSLFKNVKIGTLRSKRESCFLGNLTHILRS